MFKMSHLHQVELRLALVLHEQFIHFISMQCSIFKSMVACKYSYSGAKTFYYHIIVVSFSSFVSFSDFKSYPLDNSADCTLLNEQRLS